MTLRFVRCILCKRNFSIPLDTPLADLTNPDTRSKLLLCRSCQEAQAADNRERDMIV